MFEDLARIVGLTIVILVILCSPEELFVNDVLRTLVNSPNKPRASNHKVSPVVELCGTSSTNVLR